MSTITARVSEETAAKLSALAKATSRSKSFLVASALEQFLEENAWQVARIQDSIQQADAEKFAAPEQVKDAFSKWGLDIENN